MNPLQIITKAFAENSGFVSHNGVLDYIKEFEEKGYARIMVQLGRDFYHVTIQKGEYLDLPSPADCPRCGFLDK